MLLRDNMFECLQPQLAKLLKFIFALHQILIIKVLLLILLGFTLLVRWLLIVEIYQARWVLFLILVLLL